MYHELTGLAVCVPVPVCKQDSYTVFELRRAVTVGSNVFLPTRSQEVGFTNFHHQKPTHSFESHFKRIRPHFGSTLLERTLKWKRTDDDQTETLQHVLHNDLLQLRTGSNES
mgnify:CR=1 FL=1